MHSDAFSSFFCLFLFTLHFKILPKRYGKVQPYVRYCFYLTHFQAETEFFIFWNNWGHDNFETFWPLIFESKKQPEPEILKMQVCELLLSLMFINWILLKVRIYIKVESLWKLLFTTQSFTNYKAPFTLWQYGLWNLQEGYKQGSILKISFIVFFRF